MARRPGPREGSVGGFLVGPALLGGQAFPKRQVVLGEVFMSPQSCRKGGSASRVLPPSLVAPRGAASS
jgi:hypothetical protein